MESMDKEIVVSVENSSPPIQEMVELAKSYYDSGEIISEEYLNWQYCKNPFGYPVYSIARCENKLIGQYLVIPFNYLYKNELIKGTLSLNTLIHPNFQGKGLFTKLAGSTYLKCIELNIAFTNGFPNPMSYGGFIRKLNFKEVGKCQLMLRPIRPFPFLFDFLKNNKVKHGGDLPFEMANFEKQGVEFSKLSKQDSDLYNVFWNSIMHDKITINKNFDFIKWRYMDLPGRNYHLFKSVKNNRITSVIVLRIERVLNTNSAIIMDRYSLSDGQLDNKTLLKQVTKKLKKQKINIIVALDPNIKGKTKSLLKARFVKVPNKLLPQLIPFIYRSHHLENDDKVLESFKAWSYSFGDYDIF